MKIICSKEELLKGINIVSKAVPSKTTMAILECILIDATTDIIKLTANDMEMGIETHIEGTVLEKGMAAIDARMIGEIARKLPENEVTIETFVNGDSIQTHISCEESDFMIASRDGEEFSFLPYIEKTGSIQLSSFTLKEMIKKTIFSIAANENNKLMTGELFEINNGYLRIASLDGHRVSIRKEALKEAYENKKVVVPGKTLQEIIKILSGEQDDIVDISFGTNHIVFEFEKTTVISRLIEGEYFHIDQLLTGDYETKITVNKKNILNCIERALLLIKESDKKPVIMDIKDGNLHMSIRSQLGNMQENIAVDKQGNDLMIGFNPKFLADALRAVDEEEVSFYMLNRKAPCFIRDEDGNYIYLVLPVNFNISK